VVLLHAFFRCFFFLFIFRDNETFLRIFVDIGLGIKVVELDAKDDSLAAGEDATNEQIFAFSSCQTTNLGWSWSSSRRGVM